MPGIFFVTVTFTGPDSWPALRINEWMALNQTTLSDPADGKFDDWIELFNPGVASADLSGWFLSDDPAEPFKYRIPENFSVPAGGFLLAWADEETVQNDLVTRPDLHVAFKLGAGGESILLSAPDGTLIDRVDFGRQSPDKTMGNNEDEIVSLANPTPGGVNGIPAVDPVVSFSVDGTVVTLTVTAEPGFLYAVEVSDDLLNWSQVGESVLATGDTITFIDDTSVDQRFYRFRRTP